MYQWITILCILLFFLFVSINKKECFSVGGQGNKNDISIIGKCNLDAENNISCEIFEFVNTFGESKIIQFIRPNSRRNRPTYPISIIIE